MSEKQMKKLLDGFTKSSQSLNLLQEGILSLHGVMEEFHKTADEFSMKNEMETLLPKVNEHFAQAKDIYSGINQNLVKIQEHTVEIEVRGEIYSEHLEQSHKQLHDIREMSSQCAGQATETFTELKAIRTCLMEDLIPVYQALATEVKQLKNIQHEMIDIANEIKGSIDEMKLMQQELRVQMKEYGQMMTQTRQMQKELFKKPF